MKLVPPAACSLELVEKIVAERQGGKNGAYFAGLAGEWRARVQSYIDGAGSPEVVPTWPTIEPRKKTFLNLYLSPSKGSVQEAVLRGLRNHELMVCPACGEPGAPNTLDHYLPKGQYPHFCITPYNLFPMCDACQNSKAEKTGDNTNPRFFLHPYFDVFIGNQVVELRINSPFEAPTFDLLPVAALTAVQNHLVARHIQELEIVPRFARFFRNQYRRLLRQVRELRDAELSVEENLKVFRAAAEHPSKNTWDHVFYASVLANLQLLQFLKTENLPEYL